MSFEDSLDGFLSQISRSRTGSKDTRDAYHRDVKGICEEAGLTQRDLAERFFIPRRTVEDWCRGVRTPPDYVRLMMQELLGLI